MIFLRPQGGLANRLRVISSAIWLSKSTNQKLSVIWEINSDLNCDYNTLFSQNEEFNLIPFPEKFKFLHHTNNPIFTKRVKAYLRNRFLGIQYNLNEGDFLYRGFTEEIKIRRIAKKNKNLFICTTQAFGGWREYVNCINFHQDIVNRIIKDELKLSNNAIGLHIRRTDNLIAIENSPYNLFENIIERLSKNSANQIFFLATDDENIKNHLCNSFSSVKTFRHQLNRNSEEGMINAATDLLTLSKCQTIYGSFWSSYSELASLIGKCPLKIVHVNDNNF